MTAERTIAIFGSCVSRDNFNRNFNADYRDWYTVSTAANQSSVVALMSPPIESDVLESDGLNEYDAWNVRSDLERSFLAEVAVKPPDYVILDFFGDMHFGLIRLADGRYATNNRWKLHKTAQYAGWRDGGTIAETLTLSTDPEKYFALWTAAMDQFAAHVAETCPETTVVVNRGFYTGQVTTGETGRPTNLRKHARLARLKVREANAIWAKLDEYAISTYGWASIDLRGEHYTSTDEHKWGPFWVHYSPEFYHRFLAELHQIDLTRRTDGEASAKIAAVTHAGRERLLTQQQFIRSAVRFQTAEVRRLEHRGPLRSLRTAVRTRRQGAP